ncbi:hypothetical protein BgiBS90_034250, partial [Biomphalaria glabrata]
MKDSLKHYCCLGDSSKHFSLSGEYARPEDEHPIGALPKPSDTHDVAMPDITNVCSHLA